MSTRRKSQSRNPAGPDRRVASTGIKVEAVARHHANIPDPKPGEHLWVTVGMWQITAASALDAHQDAAAIHLDYENLLTIEGPGCYWCERPFSPELATEPCPGEPQEEAQ